MLQLNATRHIEKQPEQKHVKKPDIRTIPVRLICDNCYKEFEIKYSTQNARIHKGRPNLCNNCMRSYRSELHSAKMKGEDSWWNSLSQEEQQRRMELCWKGNENYHQSMSDDEKQRLLDKRLNGYYQWLDSLTPEEKAKRYEYLRACFQQYCCNMSVDDKLEMSKRISDASKTDGIGRSTTGQLVNIHEYVEFNDSKRQYQTDGLPVYIVKCLDDNLSDKTPVVNLDTGEITTFKSFIAILRFINMNNKERRDVVKCLN